MTDEVEEYLKEYFTNKEVWNPDWNPSCNNKEQEDILAEIKDTDDVLDVGCGYHPFKGRIKNLFGIDKYNSCADLVTDMLDFKTNKEYDVVLALGSTNLHNWTLIERQIEKIVSWTKPGGRIYMRVNPGLENVISPQKGLYKWTISDIHYVTSRFNLTMLTSISETSSQRYIWTWQK